MAPKFGTSGLRGLVTELTNDIVAAITRSFLETYDTGGRLWIGHDLRSSSPGIARVVANATADAGLEMMRVGAVPSPLLAMAVTGLGAVMVTGSHIPADRNGLKFYTCVGGISKDDELAIMAGLGQPALPKEGGSIVRAPYVGTQFANRYVKAFGSAALSGYKIGAYSHSAVGRDCLIEVLEKLGAGVIERGRSEVFVPVETEAVDATARNALADWAARHSLDALVSSDGDSDPLLLTDEDGRVIAGDIFLGRSRLSSLGGERHRVSNLMQCQFHGQDLLHADHSDSRGLALCLSGNARCGRARYWLRSERWLPSWFFGRRSGGLTCPLSNLRQFPAYHCNSGCLRIGPGIDAGPARRGSVYTVRSASGGSDTPNAIAGCRNDQT